MSKPIMVVGTSAPRRRALVEKHFGDRFEMIFISPSVDEKQVRSHDPYTLTQKVAELKMSAIVKRVTADRELRINMASRLGSVVVTFDQVVVWRDELREKPATMEENRRFIASYANSLLHTVQCTVMHSFETGREDYHHNRTTTYYGNITDEAVARIVKRGASWWTAGAFVVEDVDMQAAMLKIDPGDEDEVQGVSASAIQELLITVS